MAEILFLGSSAPFQLPSFYCSCWTCQAARNNPKQHRTRASIALIGQETVLIDAGPDLEFQLERESIRKIQRIFITHWHFDHVWGLAALGEPSRIARWPRIEVYIPSQVAYHFDQELAYMKDRVKINPISPGDRFELPDASWEVVKTTHNPESVGYIIESSQRVAYLVDGIFPPSETLKRLKNIDLLILEATVDELLQKKGEKWDNFSLQQAIDCWKKIGSKECILTHLSCHSWNKGKLVAGFTESERLEVEAKNPGLKFAYDGMRLEI
ncbi:MAG: MBL fold metallo-hydrolase [Candidatus Bathyarchaeota archaeon]|nr:MAG: MBL fold metallo-hydrolase [Candidatus Bathyarchaeota archaeon]